MISMTTIKLIVKLTDLTEDNFICFCGGNLKLRPEKHPVGKKIIDNDKGEIYCLCDKCNREANHTYKINIMCDEKRVSAKGTSPEEEARGLIAKAQLEKLGMTDIEIVGDTIHFESDTQPMSIETEEVIDSELSYILRNATWWSCCGIELDHDMMICMDCKEHN